MYVILASEFESLYELLYNIVHRDFFKCLSFYLLVVLLPTFFYKLDTLTLYS